MIELEKIIGMAEEEFKKLNLRYRTVKRDGEGFIITMECRLDRYNLEVENGLITNVYMG